MKVLHLTLKKKWFDMIASGEKKEEYREIKAYWVSRLVNGLTPAKELDNYSFFWKVGWFTMSSPEHYDIVEFRNGYGRNTPTIRLKIKDITTGTAKPEWSDNWHGDVFVIKLGEIINQLN